MNWLRRAMPAAAFPVLASIVALALPAAAQTSSPAADYTECTNKSVSSRGRERVRADACTRAIDSGQYRGKELAELYASRGTMHSFMNDYARAVADRELVFEIDPNHDVTVIFYRGRDRMYNKDRDGAIKDMQLYLEKFYRLPKSRFDMHTEGLASQARAALRGMSAAIPPEPQDPRIYPMAAVCQRMIGQRVTVTGKVTAFEAADDFGLKMQFAFTDEKTKCPMVYRDDGNRACRTVGRTITATGTVEFIGAQKAYEVKRTGAQSKCR